MVYLGKVADVRKRNLEDSLVPGSERQLEPTIRLNQVGPNYGSKAREPYSA